MHELKYIEPGYPVYRTYIIPRTIDEQITHVRRLTEHDVEKWKKTLDKLRDFLTRIKQFTKTFEQEMSSAEHLETLADCIILFFKIPLLREVLPTVAPNPLKAYLFYRLLWRDMSKHLSYGPIEFAETCYEENVRNFIQKVVAEIFNDVELISTVEEAWLNFPADTRPGYNTSALIPHMFLTSSIAWALAVESGMNRLEAAKVRLSAILHDVGKPFDYRRHYITSPQIAKCLLSDILGDQELKELVASVEDHHREGSPVREADKIAAQIDRLNTYVEKVLQQDINTTASMFGLNSKVAYWSGEEAWNFWVELEKKKPGILRELSQKFAIDIYENKVRLESDQRSLEPLLLFHFDVGGIQEFIKRASELRCVVASSIVIDVVTGAYIPLIVQKIIEEKANKWFPLESFLYTSGGVVTLLAPKSLNDVMRTVHQKLREQCGKDHITVYLASTELSNNYFETTGRLSSKMGLAKLEDSFTYMPVELDADNLCEFCRMHNHEKTIQTTKEKVCRTCYSLYHIGNELYFAQRWNAEIYFESKGFTLKNVFQTLEWEDVSAGILELISGHTVDDLVKLGLIATKQSVSLENTTKPRIRNIGIIKMDGNLMGAFFANSISVTDALERSARVDIALKKALEEAIRNIAAAANDPEEARRVVALFSLGILYVGGDDAMLLCPSWAAIPLAYHVAQVFHREMGGAASLSIGVLATPPKHDVWASISAVSKLLDIAKSRGRKTKTGAVCYDVIEGGVVSASSIQERHESLKERNLTGQPLCVSSQDKGWYSLEEIIQIISGQPAGKINTLAYTISREIETEQSKTLKKIRTAIRKSIQVGDTLGIGSDWQPYTTVYAFKMSNEIEYIAVRELVKKWFELNQSKPHGSGSIGMPLADVDILIKMLGGGVL